MPELQYPWQLMVGVRAARCCCSEDENEEGELEWFTDAHCPEHGVVDLPRAPQFTWRRHLPPNVIQAGRGFRTVRR